MSDQLFVVPSFKGGLSTKKGVVIGAMARIEEGYFDPARITQLRERGIIAMGREIEAAALAANPPEGMKSPREIVKGELAQKAKEPEDRGQGKWRFSEEMLAGKTLEQLNVAVHEIDEKVQPFDTEEEARAWLSQDLR